MRVSEVVHSGRFWDFYSRLRQGPTDGLAVVSCGELGTGLDRFLRPTVPRLTFQNAGGCCECLQVDQGITDLLVLHHENCAFHCHRTPGMSLLRAWKQLRNRRLQLGLPRDLAVHLWLLEKKGGLLVLDPETGLLQSPIQLSSAP